MSFRWIDVSIPLRGGMAVWPGDPPYRLTPLNRVSAGGDCNTSKLEMCVHCGTHVDAPWHYEEDGPCVDGIDPRLFFGPALVVDLPDVARIGVQDIPDAHVPERVLFRTRNSTRAVDAPFFKDYVAVGAEAAVRLGQVGCRLVGVDYLSVAPFDQPGDETHHRLLDRGIVVVEGLRLAEIPAGMCEFVVLPLQLIGADGSPCRAFVGLENGRG